MKGFMDSRKFNRRTFLSLTAVTASTLGLSSFLSSCGSSSSESLSPKTLDSGVFLIEEEGNGIPTSEFFFSTSSLALLIPISATALTDLPEKTQKSITALLERSPMPVFALPLTKDNNSPQKSTTTKEDLSVLDKELTRLKVNTLILVTDNLLENTTDQKDADEKGDNEDLAAALATDGRTIHILSSSEDSSDFSLEELPEPTIEDSFSSVAVLSTPQSPLTAQLTALSLKKLGATVLSLSAPDPRISTDSIQASTSSNTLVALGKGFGSQSLLEERVEKAKKVHDKPELQQPGGGALVFPGRHVVALYGHPSGGALGAMGEQNPEESVRRIESLVKEYQPLSPDPVIPAFEIIATIASSEPGPSGTYTNYSDPQELMPYVEAITDAGGYAVLDVQPGKETMLTQIRHYEDLISRPRVGIALDPEWRLKENERPLEQIGSVSAQEINEVITWLDDYVEKNNLEQKLIIIHQFQMHMIENREQLSSGTDNVCVLIHCDGHGTPDLKMGTWEAVRQGLSPQIALGWKNFYDEDTPTFSPQETMSVSPTPDFISYQ